jgi:nucleoside-diphosphate-sugar epimerase
MEADCRLSARSCHGGRSVRVLVTGASGFLGRPAIRSLADRGAEVFALARNLSRVAAPVRQISSDLFDAERVRQIVDDVRPHAILHLAWYVAHDRFWQAAENLDHVAATMWLARVAADAGVSRFVGVGTCFEYAWPESGLCDEFDTAVAPATLYGISKDAAQRILSRFASNGAFSFAWARPFHLYGPFEPPLRLVASIAAALGTGRPARISSGMAVRDFMDVRDAGDALAALTLSPVTGPVNIASGRAASVAEIADQLGRIAGRPDLVMRGALPDRPDEPPRVIAATARLAREVGFVPSRSLEQGLAEAYAWWQTQLATGGIMSVHAVDRD